MDTHLNFGISKYVLTSITLVFPLQVTLKTVTRKQPLKFEL